MSNPSDDSQSRSEKGRSPKKDRKTRSSSRNSRRGDSDSSTRGNGSGGRKRSDAERKTGRGRGSGKVHRGHSQRGGRGRDSRENLRYSPNRRGYREERDELRAQEPAVPENIDARDLDPLVRQDLRVLSKANAEMVAKHIVAALEIVDDDPMKALAHSRAAKNRAGRVGVVREFNGVVAYRAEQWREALAELRAARRIQGGPGLLPIMADCERGLERPEKAVEMARSAEASQLDEEDRIELMIVAAGARRDLGQLAAALATLERLSPSLSRTDETNIRVCYAYADALTADGRVDKALEYFRFVAAHDAEGLTDAAARISELFGDSDSSVSVAEEGHDEDC